MITVVLDTNTLVSGLGWSGAPSVIVDGVLAGALLMVSSPPLLAELERVLAYPKLAHVFSDPSTIARRIGTVADVVEPAGTLAVVADEPDNRVLEAAVEAHVDAVVTGDGGLLALKSYDGIPIMSAAAFLEWCARTAQREVPCAEPGAGHRGARRRLADAPPEGDPRPGPHQACC